MLQSIQQTSSISAESVTSADLQRLLHLCIVSLISRTMQQRVSEEEEEAEQAPPAVHVDFEEKDVLNAIQQLLLGNARRPSALPASPSSPQLTKQIALQLALLAELLEDDYHLSLAIKTKAALLSLLSSSSISLGDLVLHPPFACHVTETSLLHWIWRQNPGVKAVGELHDALFSSAFAAQAESDETEDVGWQDGGALEPRSVHHVQAAMDVAAAEPNALKALIRRWKNAVKNCAAPSLERSPAMDELLLFTQRLQALLPVERLIGAGILEPITQLLATQYYQLFQPERHDPDASLPVSLLALLLLLVNSLPRAMFHVDHSFLPSAFRAAVELLLVHGQFSLRSDAALAFIGVQLLSVQLMNAVLRYEEARASAVHEYIQVLQSDGLMAAVHSLQRYGQSHSLSSLLTSSSVAGARRVQLSNGRSLESVTAPSAELVHLRVQLQLATMELSTLLARLDPQSRSLEHARQEDVLALLHHPCLEVKLVAMRYLVALLDKESAVEEEETGEAWSTEVTSHELLLTIQSSLLPHCPAALSIASLDLLAALLAASPSALQCSIRSQPWHAFVLQSRMFTLRQDGSTGGPQRMLPAAVLLRYLHLLLGDHQQPGASPLEEGERDSGIVHLHLAHMDSRLLMPLLTFLPLSESPAASSTVCVASMSHFISVLCHLQSAKAIPLSSIAWLQSHLQVVLAFVRQLPSQSAQSQPLLCPASVQLQQPSALQTEESQSSQPSQSISQSMDFSQPSQSSPSSSPPEPLASRAAGGAGLEHSLCMCGGRDAREVRDVRLQLQRVEEQAETLLQALRKP